MVDEIGDIPAEYLVVDEMDGNEYAGYEADENHGYQKQPESEAAFVIYLASRDRPDEPDDQNGGNGDIDAVEQIQIHRSQKIGDIAMYESVCRGT